MFIYLLLIFVNTRNIHRTPRKEHFSRLEIKEKKITKR